jgi:hypothetical protein
MNHIPEPAAEGDDVPADLPPIRTILVGKQFCVVDDLGLMGVSATGLTRNPGFEAGLRRWADGQRRPVGIARQDDEPESRIAYRLRTGRQ